jgi:hypothetical protein
MDLHPSEGAKFHTGDEVTAKQSNTAWKGFCPGKGPSALFKPILIQAASASRAGTSSSSISRNPMPLLPSCRPSALLIRRSFRKGRSLGKRVVELERCRLGSYILEKYSRDRLDAKRFKITGWDGREISWRRSNSGPSMKRLPG